MQSYMHKQIQVPKKFIHENLFNILTNDYIVERDASKGILLEMCIKTPQKHLNANKIMSLQTNASDYPKRKN